MRAPFALCLLVAACGDREAEAPGTPADADTMAAGEPAGHDESAEIPSRAAEIERDAGSKPQEVMDWLGIGEGDEVADIFAGGGYYTYLLSERVGPTGRVWAQGFSPGLASRVESGDLAGATNVCSDRTDRYPRVDPDALVAGGLDVVLLASEPWPFSAGERDEIAAARTFGDATVLLCDGRDFCWHGAHSGPGVRNALALFETFASRERRRRVTQ